MSFINRVLHQELERLSALYPVVVVTGPRQSGKTTLCKKQFPGYHYVNLEDISIREQIALAPKAFLQQYARGLIIDEAQQYPELFSYIQVVSDASDTAKFILTGSSNFSLMEKITQSLAGRAALLTLLPLSLAELGNRIKVDTDIILLNGGYPAVWAKKIPVQDVSRNYYNTYIERDVRQLLNVKDMTRFQTFIRLCAGRTGTELNASALSNEVGVSVPTVKEWLSTLEASYILFRLPPFYRNIGKRLVKAPKLYFYDTGLVCFLLGIENEKQLAAHPLRGSIFENLVVLEFIKM
ncbi:MAG TPA: ATP-binding protein, partial [Hanamia sp.]|nr:ATP-binding protein [Hanamia sp.]